MLQKLKELYLWGDISKEEYQKEKELKQGKLAKLTPVQTSAETLKKLANLLSNIGQTWDVATLEQSNKLASCLFEEVWVKDKDVIAVKPQLEFEPFFQLSWDEFSKIMKLKAHRGRI